MAQDTEREDLQRELSSLYADLNSPMSDIGDWKVCKYQEYILTGQEPPYDIKELNTKRQAARDRINEILQILDTATDEESTDTVTE